MIHVPPEFHLSPEEERRRYDFHENDPEDQNYRNFLQRILDPMLELLPEGSSGLDFGSGPGPTLSTMFSERGFPMQIYDPFYADDRTVLERKYDFVTCTETFEHFSDPKKEWELLLSLIKTGGLIAIMTDLLKSEDDFPKWHYKNDETHIIFFSKKTFQWLANIYKLNISFYDKSVIVFHRY